MLAERGEAGHKYLWQLQRTFAGVQIEGARVLDVGAGWGRHTLFFSAAGAAEVTALEPESHGAGVGVAGGLENVARARDFRHVTLLREDFLSAELPAAHYDIVFTHAVINHICETPEVIRPGTSAEAAYQRVFGRMYELLRPGGVAFVIDANRRHVGWWLKRLGWQHPLVPDVDWDLHQTPATWRRLMRRAGFARFELQRYCPYAFRGATWAWANPLVDFLTYGMFCLRAWK